MPDIPSNFHASVGKRLILVIEDEAINRMMLGGVLEQDNYRVLFASTGREALEIIYQNKDFLSLVLLDLILGDMYGLDVLHQLKTDPDLARIPVIVMTSDKDAEVECLTLGAIDFIPKPYPKPQVIQARVRRTIELSEDRDIIRWTERDQLTGLYNREFFYRYAEQFDMHHKDLAMDAIVVDVNHFHMINERYGKAYGDEVLKKIAEKALAVVKEAGGIVCRREADTFLIYCPHLSDYSSILENASAGLDGDVGSAGRVRLRMGVYSEVDKSIDVERRFDRAKMAADTVRSNYTKAVAIYDSALHESEIFAEQLLEDFRTGITEKQFQVYYQPKYNVRYSEPVLSSAEALVRWQHPTLGMISPGIFIPLFERNGLIPELDNYVWREVAAQLRDWKERLGHFVPISVNVSRIDMYDPHLVETMEALIRENCLSPEDFLLEITESAYTQDSEQIIDKVKELRRKGFRIEMDDFGTGYSSLNMISSLPIDALKLDMQFIRNAFSERKDTRMLEVIIEIAEFLAVPTIAEGVETAEQMFTLRSMGCDIVQGYYFSRPVPAPEFEKFLQKLRESRDAVEKEPAAKDSSSRSDAPRPHEQFTYDAFHDPLTGLYNNSGYEMLLRDADQRHLALMIVDIDNLREIQSSLGRATSDRVVRRVADVLRQNFRSVDLICRIRNDEFVVIMTRVNSEMRDLIFEKLEQVNEHLRRPVDDLPVVSLSAGVAFSDRENPQGDLFHDADTALFRMKEARLCGVVIY